MSIYSDTGPFPEGSVLLQKGTLDDCLHPANLARVGGGQGAPVTPPLGGSWKGEPGAVV